MFSRSGVYALQATLHLAQQPMGTSVSASRMAVRLAVPPEYLAKVLNRLSREGVLLSTRGVRGGYRLAERPEELTVDRIVAPFDEIRPPKVCLLGGRCDGEAPCAAHQWRVEWRQRRRAFLAETRLTDLLERPAEDALKIDREDDTHLLKTGS